MRVIVLSVVALLGVSGISPRSNLRHDDSSTTEQQSNVVVPDSKRPEFWDLEGIEMKERKRLLKYAKELKRISHFVDWDRHRDEFFLAAHNQQKEKQGRRRLSRVSNTGAQRRKRNESWNPDRIRQIENEVHNLINDFVPNNDGHNDRQQQNQDTQESEQGTPNTKNDSKGEIEKINIRFSGNPDPKGGKDPNAPQSGLFQNRVSKSSEEGTRKSGLFTNLKGSKRDPDPPQSGLFQNRVSAADSNQGGKRKSGLFSKRNSIKPQQGETKKSGIFTKRATTLPSSDTESSVIMQQKKEADQELAAMSTVMRLKKEADQKKPPPGLNLRQAGGDPRQTFNDDQIVITDDRIEFPVYDYNLGNCPDAGDSPAAVPCAPENLNQLCDKYEEGSLFSACFEACRPSFCCIHDAPPETNTFAPNCNTDVNCAQYAYCYIVWWKFHDTIGPATTLRLEQNDDFFDIMANEVQGDVTNQEFFQELLFHHFDDSNEIIRLASVETPDGLDVDTDRIFLNSTYWETTI